MCTKTKQVDTKTFFPLYNRQILKVKLWKIDTKRAEAAAKIQTNKC